MSKATSRKRRNIRTQRHNNERSFLDLADDVDQVLSRHGLTRVTNPGSVSWKFPPGHGPLRSLGGVAAAELTHEGDGRSFGFNEEEADRLNPDLETKGLFQSAFKVIPTRKGTASFLDFRLAQDADRRRQDLQKMCALLGLKSSGDELDDEGFSNALQSL